MGFRMRQLLIAAVHSKALKLKSSYVSSVTAGKAVNLISNDVRRCDDAAPFLIYSILGPLELFLALLFIAQDIGFLPAAAGLGTMMLLVPGQVRPFSCELSSGI